MNPLLAIESLKANYGSFQALFEVNLAMQPGDTLAVIGANGAGKTTLLHALMGDVAVVANKADFAGLNLLTAATRQIVAAGITIVPEGRHLFPNCTVAENLQLGAASARTGPWNQAEVVKLFPEIEPLLNRRASDLSGGQQQMVALGRGLMSNPRLLLCDELSLGLAPKIKMRIYESVPQLKSAELALILVEQDIYQALEVADYAICLQEGRLTLEGKPADLDHGAIHDAYFGAGM